jgi:CheY-like chemotaxis protein
LARKILLADDSVTAQNMGRKILADAGYEVITVNNGSAALKKIGEQKPDLIVLDVYMPGYSGLEVCQRLKEAGETARIPILLTVGKLEPFKTDEAKRVRADGFIVKPFEASELLSALSKLEDKIVPRAESKPGRFARATAAIEEGRDRTVAAEEDSGWKSRISFPSKKKEPAAEPEADDPAIYNPVNKDLRTVVEPHPAAPVDEVAQEGRVDLGALAPEGLPKDVTPEEIAALAAAAAQMQGRILESKAEEQRESVTELKTGTAAEVASTEAAKAETAAEPSATSATFAEQGTPEKTEVATSIGTTTPTETTLPQVAAAQEFTHAGTEEPVTMAAAAGAHSGGSVSRWTAVAVALAPEESGISLEQEMQRAYSEFAATAESSPVPAMAAAEVVAEVPVAPVPEAAPADPSPVTAAMTAPAEDTFSSVASVAAEMLGASVKEFETVTPREIVEETASQVEASAHVVPETPVAPEAEAASTVEQKIPAPVEEETTKPDTTIEAAQPETAPTVVPDVQMSGESQVSGGESSATAPDIAAESSSGAQVSSEVTPAVSTEPDGKSEGEMEKKDSDIASTTAAAWASWRKIRESGDGRSEHPEPSPREASEDAAAMAVAAGAEKSPEDASDSESDPAIASIVDSVLADLRPKIVEEITRKLGKKK